MKAKKYQIWTFWVQWAKWTFDLSLAMVGGFCPLFVTHHQMRSTLFPVPSGITTSWVKAKWQNSTNKEINFLLSGDGSRALSTDCFPDTTGHASGMASVFLLLVQMWFLLSGVTRPPIILPLSRMGVRPLATDVLPIWSTTGHRFDWSCDDISDVVLDFRSSSGTAGLYWFVSIDQLVCIGLALSVHIVTTL